MITNPSPQQEDFFTHIRTSNDNLLIDAVAGSGKTSTIVHGCNYLSPSDLVLFCAFNNSIVDELKSRLPSWVHCRTFHSACYAALRTVLPQTHKIDKFKSRKLLEQFCPNRREREDYIQFVPKLVGLAKNNLGNGEPNWKELIKRYDLICEGHLDLGIEYSKSVFDASLKSLNIVDFDDMLFLTYSMGVVFKPQYDIVVVDEAQDLSPLQHALLSMMLKPGGRFIGVGDPMQAIYAFRGADSDSMNKLRAHFNCTQLPLSVSYRCPKSIVAEIYRAIPDHTGLTIESAPTAIEGNVNHLSQWYSRHVTDDDAIICRNNSPLLRLAFGLLSQSRRCCVLGRDIGTGLTALVKKLKPSSIDDLTTKLDRWRVEETIKNPDNEESIVDRAECLRIFIRNSATIDGLFSYMSTLFADKSNSGVTLSSIHRAKGKEYTNTFILDPWRMPSKFAKQPYQIQQERNIQYVAISRSKLNLTYVDADTYARET